MAKMKTLTVSGQTYTVNDPEAVSFAQPQQLTAQQQHMARENLGIPSEKQITDKLCTAFRGSGAMVTCNPVAGYPLEVISHISASDTPINEVKLVRCGKNLFDMEASLCNVFTKDGDAYTGYFDAVGQRFAPFITTFIPANSTVTLSYELVAQNTVSNHPLQIQFSYEDGTSEPLTASVNAKVTLKKNVVKCRLLMHNEDIGCFITFKNPQLEIGKKATAYEPFLGMEAYTMALAEAVYGGSVNWTTGVLTNADGNTHQLMPQQITALPGVNILYSDTGDTEVTGRADPATIISELQTRLAALETAVVNNT